VACDARFTSGSRCVHAEREYFDVVMVEHPSKSGGRDDVPLAQRVAKVSLRVRDVAASAAFYRRVFGWPEAASTSARVRRLALGPMRSSQEADILELIAGRPVGAVSVMDHISVQAPSAEAVALIHERASMEDVQVLPMRDAEGARRCVIFDPDGYKIEVFARRRDR
jgi:catechol 2,3-dioxygenase-like lactoylglutathione lyase family enzyme